nr:hypothetical protein [Tanacetum cinerariifolium]
MLEKDLTKKYEELSATEKIQANCDLKATNIILQGLPSDVYLLVNHHIVAKDLWEKFNYKCKRRQSLFAAGTSGTRANISRTGGNNSGQQRVVKCFNCQGKGHMARQYPKPKRKRDAIWFRDKVLSVEAQGSSKVLNEDELAFLADPRVTEGSVTQTVITHNVAYQVDDLDAYDFDCDEISTAKAVLISYLSSYESFSLRPNGDSLRKCILSGPYKPTTVLVQVVATTDDSPVIPEHITVVTPMNMSPTNKAHFEAEKEAIHLILTGIGDEIYSTVDACQTAQEMWEAIERLQQGESLNIQDVKTNLFWEFSKFTSHMEKQWNLITPDSTS